MNSPQENRRKVATGANAPIENTRRGGDEQWSRMLLDINDMKYADALGGVNIKPSPSGQRRLPHRRHF